MFNIRILLLKSGYIPLHGKHIIFYQTIYFFSDGERLYWMEMGYGNIRIIQSSALNGSDVRQRFKSYTTAFVNYFDIYGSYIYLASNTQIVRINTLFEDEYTVLYNSTTPIAVTRVYQQGEGKTQLKDLDCIYVEFFSL